MKTEQRRKFADTTYSRYRSRFS